LFYDFCSSYPAKKTYIILEEESDKFFDKTRRNKKFDYIFNFQKIILVIIMFLFVISGIISINKEFVNLFVFTEELFVEMLSLSAFIFAFYAISAFLMILVLLNISKFLFSIIQNTGDILSKKENWKSFFLKISMQFGFLMIIYLFNRGLGLYLFLMYMLAYTVMLSQEKEFINIKKIYLKKKIEIKTLEKYIKEHSLLESREVEQIRLYEMYYTYAFALGITVASDEYLKIEKILKKDGARIEKNHILDYIVAIVDINI
jgi:hypothetical protein